ncbi:hypothetical protein BHM03_00060248, partial [Ensete ventricosum]
LVAPVGTALQATVPAGDCHLRATTPTGDRLRAAAPAGDRLRVSNRPLARILGRSRLPLQPAWP